MTFWAVILYAAVILVAILLIALVLVQQSKGGGFGGAFGGLGESILGAQAVNKSYPSFWEDYKNLGGVIHVL